VSRSRKSKSVSRPSALKHGAFSSSAFFPWESRADFEALHLELIDEWDPCGAFEEEAVFTIASCMWKKRRIREKRQLEVIAHLQTPDPQSSKQPTPFFESKIEQLKFMLSNKSTPASHGLNSDEATLLKLSNSFYGDLSEFSLKLTFQFGNKFTEHLKGAVPRENYPEFIDYVRALKTEIDEVLLPRVRNERPSDDFIATKTASEFLTPERILEDLALEERLDATMDKAIRRLAQAKALKQLSGLSRRRRDKPATLQIERDKATPLQIDSEKDDTRNDGK
jgi:hypothetical protein